MKAKTSFVSCLGALFFVAISCSPGLLHGQNIITLDGTSGSNAISTAHSTNGGLTLDLGFFVDYLIVGGGGGGGSAIGGGGGAGEFIEGTFTLVNGGVHTVGVGAGGAGRTSGGGTGNSGGSSTLFGITANGGGAGGGGDASGSTGGSGGGAGFNTGFGNRPGGSSSTLGDGSGNVGGSTSLGIGAQATAAGGGGAGGAGANNNSGGQSGGNGGAGRASVITGIEQFFAGGGGGGINGDPASFSTGAYGLGAAGGGDGGGGRVGGINRTQSGGDALANSGSGGGGAGNSGFSGAGGSGIVIVRYLGDEAATGGTVTAGAGSAIGYTIHSFTNTGTDAFDLSGVDMNQRLGVVHNGIISGSGDLSFAGPGRLTLNAANTFTGATRVNAGTLAIGANGSIAASSEVILAAGSVLNVSGHESGYTFGAEQTLSGGGTIVGDTIISGTHSPGFSPGIQAFDSNITYTVGSNVVWELIDNTIAGRGTNYDGIDVGGDLTFTGATTITLDFALAESFVDWSDSFWSFDRLGTDGWKIFDVAGTISGLENVSLAGAFLDGEGASLATARPGASFSLYQTSDGIFLNYTAIPEPSAALLVLAGAALLLRRGRVATDCNGVHG